MTASPTEYCAGQVKANDLDRHLTVLSAPAAKRGHLYALYAFNLEVAKTAEVVSEPMLGQIRLQWWREALDELSNGRPRRHEVVEALAEAFRHRSPDWKRLEAILTAREADLEAEPMATVGDLRTYARETSGSLLVLAAQLLADTSGPMAQAVETAGIAYAMARLLRAVPHHAYTRRCYLPKDRLADAGLTAGDVMARRNPEALATLVARLVAEIRQDIDAVRGQRSQLPRTLLPVLLPIALAEFDLRVIEKAHYDVFAPASDGERWRRPLALAWRQWLGRF